jgi:hypothetical protein
MEGCSARQCCPKQGVNIRGTDLEYLEVVYVGKREEVLKAREKGLLGVRSALKQPDVALRRARVR